MITDNPTISLIINTTDRAKPLQTLLRALEHQSYSNFEVIVVVGPTKDNTMEVVQQYSERITVLRCAEANLSKSRNKGLLAAQGDLVAYVDDDSVPSRNWLAQLVQLFENPALDATGGQVFMIHPENPIIQHRLGIVSSLAEQIDIQQSWLDNIVPVGKGLQWTGRMMGTNMAFRRQALLDIGGFDEFYEWLYDDTDVAIRLDYAGKVVRPVAEAVVYHIPASSRNRIAHSFNARWWVQTKSVIYFSIKNGTRAGSARSTIALRALHYVHGHWLWAKGLYRARRLTFWQFWRMRFNEVYSAVKGTYTGMFRPRQLILMDDSMGKKQQPIRKFQNEQSAYQPVIDPISGHQPKITIKEPPLRICLLSTAYPPEQYEGVGRHTNLMAKGLFELGHTVHVIAKGQKESVSFYDGAYVHRLAPLEDHFHRYRPFQKLFYALNHSQQVYRKIRLLMLNDGVQIVDSPVWMIDGLVTSIAKEIPMVVRLQTALKQVASLQKNRDIDAKLVSELEEILIHNADYLVPNSLATLNKVHEIYNVASDYAQYEIIPHGIIPVSEEKTRPFNPQSAPETLTVLYLGRLEKRKGIVDLFEAIPLVLEKTPNVRFIIAGADNSRRDGFYERHSMEYPAYFQEKYAAYAQSVKFLGEVSEEKLQQLYQSCDLFVAPSLYESFGLIYLEAMNYAKPVIGCNAGGIPEVVAHNETGLLVEPSNPIALAEAITKLLQSPIKLREFGLAGRNRLLEKFTYIQMAQSFANVYRKTIKNCIHKHGNK